MLKLTPLEKLNFVLENISQTPIQYLQVLQLRTNNIKLEDQLSTEEFDLILDKIRSDGYIDYIAGQKISNDFRASNGIYIRRNYNGTVFLQKGGYVKQEQINKADLCYKNITTFSLIFGGVAAGIYYIVELLKAFLRMFC